MSDSTIYYNLNLTNTEDQPIQASIIDKRDDNILNRADEYEMSIVRFQISAQLIPIFLPKIPNPAFPNTTDMSITLKYLGLTISQQFVQVSDLELKGIYSYSNFLENINAASKLAFAAIANPGITATAAPQFFLDSTTGLISMYFESDYLEANPNRIQIFLNQNLMNKLNFPYSAFNGTGVASGIDYELSTQQHAVLIPPAGSRTGYPYAIQGIAGNVLELKQEYVSLNTWSGFKSIVFTSNFIPTNKEFIPNITNINQNQSFSDQSQSILTDFDLDQQDETGKGNRGIFQYIPPGEYRMKSLRGNMGFNVIDCTAFIQGFDGSLAPIYLAKGTSMTLKLMFRKRKF